MKPFDLELAKAGYPVYKRGLFKQGTNIQPGKYTRLYRRIEVCTNN